MSNSSYYHADVSRKVQISKNGSFLITFDLNKIIILKVVFFCKEFCLKALTPLNSLSIIKKVNMEIFDIFGLEQKISKKVTVTAWWNPLPPGANRVKRAYLNYITLQ